MCKTVGYFASLFFCFTMCSQHITLASPLSQLEQMAQNAKQSIEVSATNALQQNDNNLVGRGEDEKIKLTSLADMAGKVVAQANKISAEKIRQFTEAAKDLTNDGSDIKKDIKSGKISSKDFAGMLNQLFTDFDKQKAQDVDYNNAKYRNPGFIEDEDEIYNIKDTLRGYDLLSDEEIEKIKKDKTEKKKDVTVANWMKIYYLFYNGPNDWKCKINNNIITLLNTISNTYLENIKHFKENKYAYADNYHIFTDVDGKRYVVFKLYAGQKINLDTMQISR